MPAPYLNSVAQLRTLDWGKSFNWDMKIPSAPSPFNTWFPATEYERSLFNINSHTISASTYDAKIPLSSASKEIRLTFLDDDNQTLENWISAWHDEILFSLDKGTVATLEEATKEILLNDLNAMRVSNRLHQMFVYPDGNAVSTGNSNSEISMITVNFIICAYKKV